MTIKSPKYSIIIPARKGIKYLPACIETIINQDYDDYELIISDDNSQDGTKEFLDKLNHPNILIFELPYSMSMTEHWELALSHAKGQWQIFVGQDDGLQPYFFKLADKLTVLAEEINIRTIMSQRAYNFWPGCEDVYGDVVVNYRASNKIALYNSKYQALRTLLGCQTYFVLPGMYTTSIFNRTILEEVRFKQKGKIFVTHPQDANLAAIACSLDSHYLFSGIPLGWVGSSPKSAGMAISAKDIYKAKDKKIPDEIEELSVEYQNKIISSSLEYSPLAGNFSIGSSILYFWQSLLQTQNLRASYINWLLCSKIFKTIMLGHVLLEMGKREEVSVEKKLPELKIIVELNGCNFRAVLYCSKVKIPEVILHSLKKIRRLWNYFLGFFTTNNKQTSKKVDYVVNNSNCEKMNMEKASKCINKLIDEMKLLESMPWRK